MITPKWDLVSPEELETIVKNSTSFRQVAIALGYSADGGSTIARIKTMLEERGYDTTHFLGKGANKNKFDYSRFVKGSAVKISSTLPALTNLRGHKCEKCGLSEWLGNPIPLEIHHKDGDHLNNELDNLELNCPNCHALTENWRGKNIDKKEVMPIEEEKFVDALRNSPNIRQALIKLGLTPAGGNYTRANELIVRYQIQHLLKSK